MLKVICIAICGIFTSRDGYMLQWGLKGPFTPKKRKWCKFHGISKKKKMFGWNWQREQNSMLNMLNIYPNLVEADDSFFRTLIHEQQAAGWYLQSNWKNQIHWTRNVILWNKNLAKKKIGFNVAKWICNAYKLLDCFIPKTKAVLL